MRQDAYGQHGLTFVDRFGVFLSQRPIVEVIQRYQRPAVLDLGCGYHAQQLVSLIPYVGEGTGVDVQISAQARQQSKLKFYEQPIDLALEHLTEKHYDVIMMISVLEHLWDPLSVISACHRLLKNNGALVLNVPNWRGKTFLEFSAFRLGLSQAYEMDDHKMYYDKRDLWPILVRAGFKPSRIQMRYHKFGLNLFSVATRA